MDTARGAHSRNNAHNNSHHMPANPTIIFDIETGPLPASELVIPPFDPSQVKLGNVKNPDLIAEKIQKAEENHAADYIRNAALDAISGQVLCIGYRIEHDQPAVLCSDADGEAAMLRQWWAALNDFQRQPKLVGFNIKAFDLPFLIRRSWRHRLTPPYWLRQGRYWNDLIVDLREVWQLGDSRAHGSLSAISRHLGLGEKAGNGADFSNLWQTDREAAINYCLRDVQLTQQVADILIPSY
jgi:predicted PolB exonuclease-like 3'-5' exonuclease